MKKLIFLSIFTLTFMKLESAIKKATGTRPQSVDVSIVPEIIVTAPSQKQVSTLRTNSFSNLPQGLQNILNEDQNTNIMALLSDQERNTILAMSDADRVANLINKDPLMKKYIQAITIYEMNECAKTIFNPAGSGFVAFYIIKEGVVAYDVNNPDNATIQTSLSLVNSNEPLVPTAFYDCNDRIFKMFLGLAPDGTMDSTQSQYQTDLYNSRNNETVDADKIKNNLFLKVVHPV